MLPLLPTHAHSDLAGSFVRIPRRSDPDGFISANESLPPDPLFMALRNLADRITRFFRSAEPETATISTNAPTGKPIIEHPACTAEPSDRIAA